MLMQLPHFILQEILTYLDYAATVQVRAACRELARYATPRVFERVDLSGQGWGIVRRYLQYVAHMKVASALPTPAVFRALVSLDATVTAENYPSTLGFCLGLPCLTRLKLCGPLDDKIAQAFNPVFGRVKQLGIGNSGDLPNVRSLLSAIVCPALEEFTLLHYPVESHALDELCARSPGLRIVNCVSPGDDRHRVYTLSYCTRRRHLVFAEARYPILGLEVCLEAHAPWAHSPFSHAGQGMFVESEVFIVYSLYCAAYCGLEASLQTRNLAFLSRAVRKLASVHALRLRLISTDMLNLHDVVFQARTICIDLGPTDLGAYLAWVGVHFPLLEVFYFPYPQLAGVLRDLSFPNLHTFHAQFPQPWEFWAGLVTASPSLVAIHLAARDEHAALLRSTYPHIQVQQWRGWPAFEFDAGFGP